MDDTQDKEKDKALGAESKADTLPPKKTPLKSSSKAKKSKAAFVPEKAAPQKADVLMKATSTAKFHKPGSFFYATKELANKLVEDGQADPASESDVKSETLAKLKELRGMKVGAEQEEENED